MNFGKNKDTIRKHVKNLNFVLNHAAFRGCDWMEASRAMQTIKDLKKILLLTEEFMKVSEADYKAKQTPCTHVINSVINHPRYIELRRNGFNEGMRFEFLKIHERNPFKTVWLIRHARTGRVCLIHPELLTEVDKG